MDYFAAMRAFARSVELGSFSKAAEERDIKVSTVSRYVSALEADLGAALFNRTTRRLHLTEAGKTFYQRVVQILADLDDARSATSSLNAHPHGNLRINIPPSFGRLHVIPHMADFFSSYPDIQVDITLTDMMADIIEAGDDLAIRVGSLINSTFIARRLARQRWKLVASPSYLAGRNRPRTPSDLHGHECLAMERKGIDCWYCFSAGDRSSGLTEIGIEARLCANDPDVLRQAALHGLGLALLPTWLVGEDLQAGRLESMLEDWEWLSAPGAERSIWMLYPPKKIVPPKVKAFLDFMTKRIGNPPYWDASAPSDAPRHP